MKSNIGFVFVVNSEKAFGRFVKESAGEEEMTSCKRRTSHLEQLQTVVSTSRVFWVRPPQKMAILGGSRTNPFGTKSVEEPSSELKTGLVASLRVDGASKSPF